MKIGVILLFQAEHCALPGVRGEIGMQNETQTHQTFQMKPVAKRACQTLIAQQRWCSSRHAL
jgi:hypothetical protein